MTDEKVPSLNEVLRTVRNGKPQANQENRMDELLLAASLAANNRLAQRERLWGLAIAASLLLSIGIWQWPRAAIDANTSTSNDSVVARVSTENPSTAADFAALDFEKPTLTLPSGDRLYGNAQASLQMNGPQLVLQRGEMLFDVRTRQDSEAPFSVRVGNLRVIALGTVFSVEQKGDGANVIQYEGHVRIERLDAAHARDEAIVLAPGEAYLQATQQRVIGEEAIREAHASNAFETIAMECVAHRPVQNQTTEGGERLVASPNTEHVAQANVGTPSQDHEADAREEEPTEASAQEPTRAVETCENTQVGSSLLQCGDNARSAGDIAQAVRYYLQSAEHSEGTERNVAGYLAAELTARRLGNWHEALRILSETQSLREGVPLSEVAFVLRLEALHRTGDEQTFVREAEVFFERHPRTSFEARVRSWLAAQGGSR